MNADSSKARYWALAGAASVCGLIAPKAGITQETTSTADDVVQEFIITGSRITRSVYDAPSPTISVSQEDIRAEGAVTAEVVLNRLPQFTPAYGASTTFPNRGGQANLNLRGLGSNRALVLLDGRRLIASNPDGSVDVNVIPNILIGGVETITGGASAAYGSDAMAGVVNMTLRKDFQGLEIDSQYNITDRGDGGTANVSVAGGTRFANDRGSAMFFVGYSDRDEVLTGDRAFPRNRLMLAYQPTGDVRSPGNPPRQDVIDALFAGYGYPNVGPVTVFGINPDGTLYKQAPTTTPVVNYRGELDDLFLNRGNQIALAASATYSLQIPLERANVFGRITYDLSDNVEVFGDVLYTQYDAVASQAFPLVGAVGQSVRVPVTNPFLPDDVRTLMASRPNPTAPFNFTTALRPLGVLQYDSSWEVYQITTGLKGRLEARDWSWDIHVSHGEVDNVDRRVNNASLSIIQAFLDAPGGGALETDPVRCEGGFNPFGREISADCAQKIRRDGVTNLNLKQTFVEANLQGELFAMPAGDARFAIGAGFRRNSYDLRPDEALQTGDLTGQPVTRPSSGSIEVSEVYGELLLPLLSDRPFVEDLSLNLGLRYSDYNTSGGVTTYTSNLEWQVGGGVQLRGGYARAVRAPSLSELYAAETPASSVIGLASPTTTAGDPCDVRSSFRQGPNAAAVRALCLAQGVPAANIDSFTATQTTAFGTTAGNRNLDPEKADTYTVGVVFRPRWNNPLFARFQSSIDYFRIGIKDAISQLTLVTSVPLCFNSTGSSNPGFDANNFYCSLIGRDSNGFINGFVPVLNLGELRTKGVDVQIDWAVALSDLGLRAPGDLSLRMAGTYVDALDVQVVPDQPFLQYAGSTGGLTGNVSPRWRSATTLGYRNGDFEASLRWRRVGAADDVSTVTSASSSVPGVPAVDYLDLNTSLRLKELIELRAGVTNLSDRRLPQVGSVQGNSDFSTYDGLGRSYFLGLRAKF